MRNKFTTLCSTVVPLPIENIDTDQIIPARFLKATTREGFGENLFRDWRFDKEGNPSPVYRERFICTRDGAGDAQEFVDYYLGDITRSSMPAKSLVVNDATERAVETHAAKMPVARHTNILFERK